MRTRKIQNEDMHVRRVSLPDAGSERAYGPGGVDALQLLQAEVQRRGAMSQVSQLQALLLSTLHREQSAERS